MQSHPALCSGPFFASMTLTPREGARPYRDCGLMIFCFSFTLKGSHSHCGSLVGGVRELGYGDPKGHEEDGKGTANEDETRPQTFDKFHNISQVDVEGL